MSGLFVLKTDCNRFIYVCAWQNLNPLEALLTELGASCGDHTRDEAQLCSLGNSPLQIGDWPQLSSKPCTQKPLKVYLILALLISLASPNWLQVLHLRIMYAPKSQKTMLM